MTRYPKKRQNSKKNTQIEPSLIPDLPLIDGENNADYIAFQDACLKAVGPKDALERIWLQDFIDYSWEALRLRRAKPALIKVARKEAVTFLLTECLGGDRSARDTAPSIAHGWSANEAEDLKIVEDLFAEHGYDTDTVIAQAIATKLDDLERIDRLIAFYNIRRDASLRELEKRRDVLAKRAREFSEKTITDAEVEFLDAAE
jgi:hypothetical protein